MPTTPSEIGENVVAGLPRIGELVTYECERCGYRYEKKDDFPPFLCYRCIRFIAKRTWTTVKTIQPISEPEIPKV